MGTFPMRTLLALAVAALAGCTTTQAARGVKVSGPDVKAMNDNGGAVQAEVVPQVSQKAKLLFEDALKSYEPDEEGRQARLPGAVEEVRAPRPTLIRTSPRPPTTWASSPRRQGKTKDAMGFYREALSPASRRCARPPRTWPSSPRTRATRRAPWRSTRTS